jgi:acylphosphatase
VSFTEGSYDDRERRRSHDAKRRALENRRMAKHLVISGHVQGVGFRYSMAEKAERAGATGWVRNRRDGTVEAVVDGPAGVVDTLVAWARRGPPGARVAGVQVDEIAGSFERFETRPTA